MIAIDTNILVTAFDYTDPRKRDVSRKIFREITSGEKKAFITSQVIAEFAFVATKKLKIPLTPREACSVIEVILSSENWTVIEYTGKEIIDCLQLEGHFWDGLIASTLMKNNVDTIITENVKDFKKFGLKVINPY